MDTRFNSNLLISLLAATQSKTGNSKVQILEQIGINDATYYNITSSGKLPSVVTLARISRYFNVPMDDFFEDTAQSDDAGPGGLLPPALHDTPPPAVNRRGRKPTVAAGEGQMALLAKEVAELREQLSEVVRHMTVKIRVYMFGGLGWCPGSCTPSWAS
jgi:transcriptional regulator with XRE-family HTH domain